MRRPASSRRLPVPTSSSDRSTAAVRDELLMRPADDPAIEEAERLLRRLPGCASPEEAAHLAAHELPGLVGALVVRGRVAGEDLARRDGAAAAVARDGERLERLWLARAHAPSGDTSDAVAHRSEMGPRVRPVCVMLVASHVCSARDSRMG